MDNHNGRSMATTVVPVETAVSSVGSVIPPASRVVVKWLVQVMWIKDLLPYYSVHNIEYKGCPLMRTKAVRQFQRCRAGGELLTNQWLLNYTLGFWNSSGMICTGLTAMSGRGCVIKKNCCSQCIMYFICMSGVDINYYKMCIPLFSTKIQSVIGNSTQY